MALTERIQTLRRHGFSPVTVAAMLGLDTPDVEGVDAGGSVSDPVVVGGGGAFTLPVSPSAVAPIADSAVLADYDLAAFQATDPSRAALVILRFDMDATAVGDGSIAQASWTLLLFAAKPAADNTDSLVELDPITIAVSCGSGGSTEVRDLHHYEQAFVLPPGYWAAGVFDASASIAPSNVSFQSATQVNFALG